MLLFWCHWFKYRYIKLDLVTVGKFCFHFSRILGGIVVCVNVNPACAWHLNHALCDVQNMCALTKVGTVLNLCLCCKMSLRTKTFVWKWGYFTRKWEPVGWAHFCVLNKHANKLKTISNWIILLSRRERNLKPFCVNRNHSRTHQTHNTESDIINILLILISLSVL